MNKFKMIFLSESAVTFNTNMIKIALNLREDKVAAVILSQCPVVIEDKTLKFSI